MSAGRHGSSITPTHRRSSQAPGAVGWWVMTEDRLVGGWLLLTVTEDLVGAGAGRLRQRLLVNSPARHRYLVLDLSAVDRIDSTGLGVLVGARKRLRAGNGQLRLAAASGNVARVLHATGLDKVLPLYPDVASARSCSTAPAAADQLSSTTPQAKPRIALGRLQDPHAHQRSQSERGQSQHAQGPSWEASRTTHETSTATGTARR